MWISWLEHPPINQKVVGSNPSQDTYLGYGFDPWSGCIQEARNPSMFLTSMFLSSSLSKRLWKKGYIYYPSLILSYFLGSDCLLSIRKIHVSRWQTCLLITTCGIPCLLNTLLLPFFLISIIGFMFLSYTHTPYMPSPGWPFVSDIIHSTNSALVCEGCVGLQIHSVRGG